MKRLALALCLATTAACNQGDAGARDVVASTLLDPASATFSDVRLVEANGVRFICGTMRGISALGGPGDPVLFAVADSRVELYRAGDWETPAIPITTSALPVIPLGSRDVCGEAPNVVRTLAW